MDNGKSPPTELSVTPTTTLPKPATDDNLSIKSSDSVTTSGEYEIVPEAPSLSDVVDGTLPSPIMNIVKTTSTRKPQEPIREPKQPSELNLDECLGDDEDDEDDDQLVVPPVAGAQKKLDAISPILNIEGNGNVLDLEKNMDEVIHELEEERTLSASDDGEQSGSANKSELIDFVAFYILR